MVNTTGLAKRRGLLFTGRYCPVCGTPICQVWPWHRPRIYCCDACKMRAYRQRKKQRLDESLSALLRVPLTDIGAGPGLIRRFLDWLSADG